MGEIERLIYSMWNLTVESLNLKWLKPNKQHLQLTCQNISGIFLKGTSVVIDEIRSG